LVIQDASQLILHYGERQANVILSMVGNIISSQVIWSELICSVPYDDTVAGVLHKSSA
jgi:hypothetical protein